MTKTKYPIFREPDADADEKAPLRFPKNLLDDPVVGFFDRDGRPRKGKPLCEQGAWFYLCAGVSDADRIDRDGKTVLIDHGQIIGEKKRLVWRWGWTENQVVSFLIGLRDCGLIELRGTVYPTIRQNERRQMSAIAAEIYERQQIPPELRRAVYERDGFACVECKRQTHLSCDHSIAVTSGGETTLENLRTLCIPCNISKGARNK